MFMVHFKGPHISHRQVLPFLLTSQLPNFSAQTWFQWFPQRKPTWAPQRRMSEYINKMRLVCSRHAFRSRAVNMKSLVVKMDSHGVHGVKLVYSFIPTKHNRRPQNMVKGVGRARTFLLRYNLTQPATNHSSGIYCGSCPETTFFARVHTDPYIFAFAWQWWWRNSHFFRTRLCVCGLEIEIYRYDVRRCLPGSAIERAFDDVCQLKTTRIRNDGNRSSYTQRPTSRIKRVLLSKRTLFTHTNLFSDPRRHQIILSVCKITTMLSRIAILRRMVATCGGIDTSVSFSGWTPVQWLKCLRKCGSIVGLRDRNACLE